MRKTIRVTRSMIFLYCSIAFIIGIAVVSFLPVNIAQHDLWWFIGIAWFVVNLILFWQNKRIRIISLLGLFLFLGLWRYSIGIQANTPDKIWYYNEQTVTVRGVVSNEPDIRSTNQKLEIEIKEAKFPIGNLASSDIQGKILVTTSLYPKYNYGDELEITCNLQAPEPFRGFSYDRYLARFDIYSVCYWPEIILLNSGKGNWLYSKIFQFKDKLRSIIDFGMNNPESSLARAIILGDKKGIADELRDKFSKSGISHIVAISGMHISIIAVLIMGLLLAIGISRKKAFYLASIFLVLYIILIGLPASAMRAGLMGFLVLLAMNLGRLNKLTNSLLLAAVVLLLINPKLFRDDVGFQLSFLAVLGIGYCYPMMNNWYNNVILEGGVERRPIESQEHSKDFTTTNKRSYRFSRQSGIRSRMTKKAKVVFDILAITIAAQLFTLPIIALNFNQVSIISPITNLLVLWTLPILMITSLAAIGLSLIIPSLSFIFFLPTRLVLKYIVAVAENITKLPYAYIEIEYLWWGWPIVYYLAAGWIIFKIKKCYLK